jgi:hypothetical protein
MNNVSGESGCIPPVQWQSSRDTAMQSYPQLKIVSCGFCERIFDSEQVRKKHIKKAHYEMYVHIYEDDRANFDGEDSDDSQDEFKSINYHQGSSAFRPIFPKEKPIHAQEHDTMMHLLLLQSAALTTPIHTEPMTNRQSSTRIVKVISGGSSTTNSPPRKQVPNNTQTTNKPTTTESPKTTQENCKQENQSKIEVKPETADTTSPSVKRSSPDTEKETQEEPQQKKQRLSENES